MSANGLLISYSLLGFGEVNYINPTPAGPSEQGHYWHQRRGDVDALVAALGSTPDGKVTYLTLFANAGEAYEFDKSALFYLSEELAWFGTSAEKPVTFGSGSREELRLFNGFVHLGDGANANLKPHELGFEKVAGAGTAPGAGKAKVAFEDDPANPGKARLVAYAGTSSAGTVIADNIGDGF